MSDMATAHRRTLHDRRERWRTVTVRSLELWVEVDRYDEVIAAPWMARAGRNTSRRAQAISVERLATAYEPRGGWPVNATTGERHDD